jgi:hypothetical protein
MGIISGKTADSKAQGGEEVELGHRSGLPMRGPADFLTSASYVWRETALSDFRRGIAGPRYQRVLSCFGNTHP